MVEELKEFSSSNLALSQSPAKRNKLNKRHQNQSPKKDFSFILILSLADIKICQRILVGATFLAQTFPLSTGSTRSHTVPGCYQCDHNHDVDQHRQRINGATGRMDQQSEGLLTWRGWRGETRGRTGRYWSVQVVSPLKCCMYMASVPTCLSKALQMESYLKEVENIHEIPADNNMR